MCDIKTSALPVILAEQFIFFDILSFSDTFLNKLFKSCMSDAKKYYMSHVGHMGLTNWSENFLAFKKTSFYIGPCQSHICDIKYRAFPRILQ